MDKIAEFMGWHWGCSNNIVHATDDICVFCGWFTGSGATMKKVASLIFNPTEDWNHWKLVEKRIRERGLYDKYYDALAAVMFEEFGDYGISDRAIFQATLPQRAEALIRVLDGSQTQEDEDV